MPMVRIICPEKQESEREHLLKKAKSLAKPKQSNQRQSSITSSLKGGIASLIDDIQQWNHVAGAVRKGLSYQECQIETDLMRMEQRMSPYSPYLFPEREKMLRRLQEVGAERRRFAVQDEQQLRDLHDRLREAVTRHDFLQPIKSSDNDREPERMIHG